MDAVCNESVENCASFGDPVTGQQTNKVGISVVKLGKITSSSFISLKLSSIIKCSSNIASILSSFISLTHSHLKGLMKIVVWIYGNFDNNFGIKKYFTKYLKESCW